MLWRALRRVPLFGALVRLGDRMLWSRTIRASGVVDAGFYAAQRGWRSASDRRAVRDYVARGFRRGLSLNPLVDELVAGRELPEPWRVPALYAYLVSDRATVRLHPWWDAMAVRDSSPSSDSAGPLERMWTQGEHAPLELQVGLVRATISLGEFRGLAQAAARRWKQSEMALAAASASASGRPSLLWLVQRQDREYDRRLGAAIALAGNARVVVSLIDADASQHISLAILQHLLPAVEVVAISGQQSFGELTSLLVPRLGNGVFAVIEPAVTLNEEEVRRLWAAVAPGQVVAPVQLQADGTVASFGAARIAGAGVYRVLADHPVEDLAGFEGARVDVPLLAGRTFAMTGADFEQVAKAHGGTAPQSLAQISARLAALGGMSRVSVLTDILCARFSPDLAFGGAPDGDIPCGHSEPDDTEAAVALLRRAGFRVRGWESAGDEPAPILEWLRPHPSSRRWAIKICAPAGPAGDVWGDRHFGRGLAAALRRAGHFVAVDAFDAKDRPTSRLDDVTLVVRGPYRIDPPETGVRLEWIISHPDLITPDELSRFDAVFAASERWSTKVSREWQVAVEPLLECTDIDLFRPQGLPRGDDIVFVGTARGIARPSVVVPLNAGIPVKVYGPDWRTYISAAAIAATSIPNEELPERYETASIDLNDQWPAMKREGFMAMRPFDVDAAGGRVISVDVDGIEALFQGAVIAYSDEEDLVRLLRSDPNQLFPTETRLAEISAKIRELHSFDARSRDLVAAASAVEAERATTKRPRGPSRLA